MIDENNPLGGQLEIYDIKREQDLVEEFNSKGFLDKKSYRRLKVENKIKQRSRDIKN